MNKEKIAQFFNRLDGSAVLTVIGIIILFSGALIVTLEAPRFVDKTWTSPSSYYQVQMYEVADPNFYISSTATGSGELEFVHHLRNGYTLHAFKETETVRIVSPPELENYVTQYGNDNLKLTSKLLLLRTPKTSSSFDAKKAGDELKSSLQQVSERKVDYDILELYDPGIDEAFAVAYGDGVTESFVDDHYTILDIGEASFHRDPGVVYVNNPQEYKISKFKRGAKEGWRYDPYGQPVGSLQELKGEGLGFLSRKELIELGEHIYTIEGCWYCHTDQTRTLIQDVVLNGSDSYPAPPSSANEYIYQKVTFPGTRRIGPDMSRVGVKRPNRDWHKSHFWSPKTASKGSIMPSFKHFFDNDPSGSPTTDYGVPNYKFEAVFQYLMTKGTRIDPPTQAWWLGKDPIQTLDVIEGRKTP